MRARVRNKTPSKSYQARQIKDKNKRVTLKSGTPIYKGRTKRKSY